MVQLARLGADSVLEKQKEPEKKEEEVVEEETIEQKHDKLNQEFLDYKKDQEQKNQIEIFKQNFNTAFNKAEIFKQFPISEKNAKILVAAAISRDHSLSIDKAVEQVAKEKLEEVKEIQAQNKHATNKVRAAVEQVQRGGGGLAALESDKPLTAEYVKSGKAKLDIEACLAAALEDT